MSLYKAHPKFEILRMIKGKVGPSPASPNSVVIIERRLLHIKPDIASRNGQHPIRNLQHRKPTITNDPLVQTAAHLNIAAGMIGVANPRKVQRRVIIGPRGFWVLPKPAFDRVYAERAQPRTKPAKLLTPFQPMTGRLMNPNKNKLTGPWGFRRLVIKAFRAPRNT